MEVCVDSVESAVNAEAGGASRLELCAGVAEGGITPSLGMLREVKKRVRIPVFVMLRPRGGDFLYSEDELAVMRQDLQLVKENGADGVVLGLLRPDGTIDEENCSKFLQLAAPMSTTFHRAFDMVKNPLRSLEVLIKLGFHRLLTSGCDSTALEGLPLIKQLVEQAQGRIIVVPGGGITERNLERVLRGSGATEFHCSARGSRSSQMQYRNSAVAMGASYGPPEYAVKVADPDRVAALISIAHASSGLHDQ